MDLPEWALPVACVVASKTIVTLAMTTPITNQSLRLGAWFTTLLINIMGFQWAKAADLSPGYRGMFVFWYYIFPLGALIFLHIKPYQGTLLSAYNQLSSPRCVGTSYQIKQIPPWPAYYGGNITVGTQGPPRRQFLIRQLSILFWLYCTTDIISHFDNLSAEERHRLFGPGQEMKIEWSLDHWTFRVAQAVVGGLVVARVMVNIIYVAASILAVGLNISKTANWPPSYGSIKDAYTVTRFWGVFWHQNLRFSMSGVSTWFCQRVLMLPHPSMLERIANVFFVFTLSGGMHVASNHINGLGGAMQVMLFFQSFALFMIVERLVQSWWQSYTGEGWQPSALTPRWKKVVGFAWVLAAGGLVCPLFMCALARSPPETREVLPWSAIGHFGQAPMLVVFALSTLVNIFVFKVEV